MEPVLLEEESDLDSVGIEELCDALNKSCKQITEVYNDTYMQFRGLRKKVKDEMHTMDYQPLKPKAHAKKWIVAHGLSDTPSFHDFFEAVCKELKEEDRLNITDRTLIPNKDIAKLFKVPVDQPIHIFDFLPLVPEVFQ
jgi:hypothetical protein